MREAKEDAPSLESKKVAIVHDWLIAGGAEKVVEQMHKMFPTAPIYTSYSTPEWRERLDGKVRTGFLQYWPFPKIRKYIPFLRIWWFSRLKLRGYDLIISTSGAEAKGINTPKETLHVAYIHAPTHYYWSRYNDYMREPGFGRFDWLARLGLKALVGPLRRWDFRAAQKADLILTNSHHTQAGVEQCYNRSSAVIYPPVNIERFSKFDAENRRGFVVTGRQTPYKRIDLAVSACTDLGLPLTVIGDGPEHRRLREMAGPTINFKGFVNDDEDVAMLVGEAEAFIFPGVDDFGISPVEALASGTPVIAYKAGGALDYVIPGKTGEFFEEQNKDSLARVLRTFKKSDYSSDDIKNFARSFSEEEFHLKLREYLQKVI